jgi:hypothetical protein
MYLYVKTHNTTGLKYLGKTVREDYHSYPGSGKRWIRHLKEHGFDYSTEILLATEDKQEFKETAIFFSKLWNIVSSDKWANLRIEEGDGGDTSTFIDQVNKGKSISKTKNSERWKENIGIKTSKKISTSERETKQSPEWKNTVGKRVSEEASRRQNSVEWKEAQGAIISEKAKTRWADENYKNNISMKISVTQNKQEWKNINFKTCEYCGTLSSPGNYAQYHGAKCIEIGGRLKKLTSETTRKKISLKLLGKKSPLVICPHCNKCGGVGAMKRFHFENCKHKPS